MQPRDLTCEYLSDENKNANQNYMCTPIFIATLFTVAEICEQFEHLLPDRWIKKMWYTVEYYSNTAKKEALSLAAT